jgi:signal transduction histidine kinase
MKLARSNWLQAPIDSAQTQTGAGEPRQKRNAGDDARDGVLSITTDSAQTTRRSVVSIADTGGGIPQEQINRIFEPFYTTKKKRHAALG